MAVLTQKSGAKLSKLMQSRQETSHRLAISRLPTSQKKSQCFFYCYYKYLTAYQQIDLDYLWQIMKHTNVLDLWQIASRTVRRPQLHSLL